MNRADFVARGHQLDARAFQLTRQGLSRREIAELWGVSRGCIAQRVRRHRRRYGLPVAPVRTGWRCSLTQKQGAELLRRWLAYEPLTHLAREYGISAATARRVVQGRVQIWALAGK